MTEYFGCGFARVAVRQSFFKPNGKVEYDQELRWKSYLSQFRSPHCDRFVVADKKAYDKRSKALSLHFKKWKTKDKSQYIEHFNQGNWDSLPELEKKQHERVNCQACDVHHYSFQTLFPSRGKNSSIGLQDTVKKTQKRVLQPSNAVNVKPTLKAIKKTVGKNYDGINGPFKELFGMSFAKAQTKTPELNLQEKKSPAELKKERREKLRTEKRQIEEQWSKRDCDTCWAHDRRTVSDRNSVWLCFLRPQRKQTTELPNRKALKTMATANGSGTHQSLRTLTLTRRDS